MNTSSRPGVFTGYTVLPISTMQSGILNVAIVAEIPSTTKKSLHTLYTVEELTENFGSSNEQKFYKMAEIILKNGVGTLNLVCANTSTPTEDDYIQALTVLKDCDVQIVMVDSQITEILSALKAHISDCCQDRQERFGIVGIDSVDETLTAATALDYERIVVVAPKGGIVQNDLSGLYSAAALASTLACLPDSMGNTNSAIVNGINFIEPHFTEAEVEKMLTSGVTPLERVAGNVEVIKIITTKTKSPLSSLSSLLTVDSINRNIRALLKNYVKVAKNNTVTRESIRSQLVILLSNYQDSGTISEFDNPVVTVSAEDSGVCIVKLGITIAANVDKIIITANIKL